jgi:hypothetical protein
MAGTKFRKVKPPFALNSGKLFSNWSAFTINSQNRFSSANYALKLKVPDFSRALAFVVCTPLHSFASELATSGLGCGVWPDPVCCEILILRLRLHGTCS